MVNYKRIGIFLLYLSPLALLVASFFIGRYEIPPALIVDDLIKTVLYIVADGPKPVSTQHTVLFNVRFPRIIAALLVGSALSLSGAAFQGVFKNPLVSPDILGVAAGAGFGACFAILTFKSYLAIQFFSFVFGLLAVFMVLSLGRKNMGTSTLSFILYGIVVASVFNAFISIAKYVADPFNELQAIVFWLMGSLTNIRIIDLYSIFPPIFIGSLILYLLRWRINILSLNEDEAKTLGINVAKMRLIVIVCATLITSAAVSVSGIVGWVGLVVPHICRMISGPNYNTLVPHSIVLGASFMLIADTIARSITVTEIPLGIITALVGAPLFAYLLGRGRMGWN